MKCDVGSEADILALFKAADGVGALGALVNNAGIVGPSMRVDQMTAERIQRMLVTWGAVGDRLSREGWRVFFLV